MIDWLNADVKCKDHKRLNKILAYRCAKFYYECWVDRNNAMHNSDKQKERLKKWFEKEKSKAEQSEYRQLKLCVERCKLDVNRSDYETITKWIMNLKCIERKVNKIPPNDVRRWLIV